MGLKEDFIAQARRDNWHFNFIKKTSLGPLITVLGSPPVTPQFVAAEVVKLPAAKIKKYKRAFALLNKRLPTLQHFVDAHQQDGIGLTTQTYAPGREVRRTDVDGRWYRFELQQEGNSCGPTCVRTILSQFTHVPQKTEGQIRDDVGLMESGDAYKGITQSNHDWANVGSVMGSLASVLVSYGIRTARTIGGEADSVISDLLKTSKNYPGIIGWYWGAWGDTSQGGHWTVVAGTAGSGTRLVILDPWNGVQYVDPNQFWEYHVNGASGWYNFYEQFALVTHPK